MRRCRRTPQGAWVQFGWTLLISRDERPSLGAISFAPRIDTLVDVGWGVADGTRARHRPGERRLFRGDHLRREIDAHRLCDAGAVFGIGPVAVDDLPLDDLYRHALHRCLVVLEELLFLGSRH